VKFVFERSMTVGLLHLVEPLQAMSSDTSRNLAGLGKIVVAWPEHVVETQLNRHPNIIAQTHGAGGKAVFTGLRQIEHKRSARSRPGSGHLDPGDLNGR